MIEFEGNISPMAGAAEEIAVGAIDGGSSNYEHHVLMIKVVTDWDDFDQLFEGQIRANIETRGFENVLFDLESHCLTLIYDVRGMEISDVVRELGSWMSKNLPAMLGRPGMPFTDLQVVRAAVAHYYPVTDDQCQRTSYRRQ